MIQYNTGLEDAIKRVEIYIDERDIINLHQQKANNRQKIDVPAREQRAN